MDILARAPLKGAAKRVNNPTLWEPTSKDQKATSLWTLGCHKPVIPVVTFLTPLPFSPLSFFLSPVSLALLLPPLLFGLFPPEIAVNMAQVPARTGWAMWNRLRGTGDWPVLTECMHSGFNPGAFTSDWAQHASHCATPLCFSFSVWDYSPSNFTNWYQIINGRI